MLINTYQKLSALLFLVLCAYILRQTDILTLSTSPLLSSRSLQQSDGTLENTLCKNFVFNTTTYTTSQVSLAGNIRSFLEMVRGGNPLIDQIYAIQNPSISTNDNTTQRNSVILNNNQQAVADEYGKSMNMILIFSWIFLISAVFCLLGYFCTLFSCGRRLCCLFDPEAVKTGRTTATISSGVLIISLLGLGIAGMIFTGEFHYYTKGAICNGNTLLVNMNRGSVENNWIGLMGASNALTNLSNYDNALSQDGQKLQATVLASLNIVSNTQNLIFGIYQNYQNKVLPRADPLVTLSNYTPDFITSYGPAERNNTVLSKLVKEMNAFYQSNISKIPHSSAELYYFTEPVSILQPITDNASLAVQSLLDFNNQRSSAIEETIRSSDGALKATFTILCLVLLFCIIWWLLGIKRKVRLAPGLICGKWCLILTSIVCWIVSFSYIPANIEIMETCGVINKTLSDPIFFNQTLNLLANNPDNLNQYLYTCVYGNGDLPEVFNLNKYVKNFNDTYNSTLANAALAYAEINSGPRKSPILTSFMTHLEAYKNGTIADSKSIIIDLNTLNKNSKPINSSCEPMKDTWVLNSLNCSSRGSLQVFQANETDSFNVGSPTCIGFDQWMNGTNMSINDRYSALQNKNKCGGQADDQNAKRTKRLVAGFINNRNAMKTLITNMENDLNIIMKNYTAIYISKKTWIKPLNAIMTDFSLMNDTLYNSDLGLMTNLNCGAVKGDLQILHDSICIGAVTSAFYTLVVLILISILTIAASLSLLCLVKRVKAPEARRSKRRLSASNPLLYEMKLEEEEPISVGGLSHEGLDNNELVV